MIIYNELIKRIKWDINNNGCWIVTSHSKEPQGYFPIQYNGIRSRIHRIMYMAVYGDIPENKVIRHTCDNPSCINPKHLIIGTKKDNSNDMVKRNRHSDWKDRGGSRAKLTKKEVRNIISSNKSSYELSKIYPVSAVQIRRIKNGSRWRTL